MSRTLPWAREGWNAVRTLARVGRTTEALSRLKHLVAAAELPASDAADAHRLAAEILLNTERFAAARRHLRAALAIEPGNAETCYLVGRSYEEDPEGRDDRAARWFRKAMALAPAAKYSAAFGRAAVRCGRVRSGIKALQNAAANAPGDLAVLHVVVEGLIEAGNLNEARRAITLARFLCPGDKELDRLDANTRFEMARRRQRKAQDATTAREGGFISLPFVRLVGGETRTSTSGTIRRDLLSRPRPHFNRLRQTDRG